MTKSFLNMDYVLGLFDADGSFQAKIYLGSQKPISFHVNINFSQGERDVLQTVLNITDAKNTRNVSFKKISERTVQNESGTQSKEYSISIAFSSNAGQLLLNEWKNNPPKAPTKYLDYLITRILAGVSELQQSFALDVVKKHLKHLPNVVLKDEKSAALALLWLRYQMYGRVKGSGNKLKPISHFYSKLNATQIQIDESVFIGRQLFDTVKQSLQMHKAGLINITCDYLLGYHVGDGSFQIGTTFNANATSFKANFVWSLTDCKQNLPLLEAIQKKLITEGFGLVEIVDYDTYCRLHITNSRGCLKLIEFWEGKTLPSVRQNQYNCFKKALNLYTSPDFRKNLGMLEEFIQLKWSMNFRTNKKKKNDLNQDLDKIRDWFNKKN